MVEEELAAGAQYEEERVLILATAEIGSDGPPQEPTGHSFQTENYLRRQVL
jgi:hypothetical protein